jgi:hypothetical protein
MLLETEGLTKHLGVWPLFPTLIQSARRADAAALANIFFASATKIQKAPFDPMNLVPIANFRS